MLDQIVTAPVCMRNTKHTEGESARAYREPFVSGVRSIFQVQID
jgi:hypothetical protein